MKVKIINQFREYFPDYTVSDLYLPDQEERFCYTLEDVGRPPSVKIFGETCIPEGLYKAKLTDSPKYGRKMILLYNQDDYSVERDGIRFTGIRVHSGNKIADTHGCVLPAYNFDGDDTIWQTASKDIHEKVKEWEDQGYEVLWSITRK